MPEIPIEVELEGGDELDRLRERVEKLKTESKGGSEELGKLADNLDRIGRQVSGESGVKSLTGQTTLLHKGLEEVNEGLEGTSKHLDKLDEDTKNTVRVITALTGGIATLFTTIQGVRRGQEFARWLRDIRTEGGKPWEVIARSAKENLHNTVEEVAAFRRASVGAFETTSQKARTAWVSFFDLFRDRARDTAKTAEETFQRSAQAAETATRTYRAAADEAARFTQAAAGQTARGAGGGGALIRRTAAGLTAPGGALVPFGSTALTANREIGPFTGEFRGWSRQVDDGSDSVRRFMAQLQRLDGGLASLSRWLRGVAVEMIVFEAAFRSVEFMSNTADDVQRLNLEAAGLRRTLTDMEGLRILSDSTEADLGTYLELIERLERGIGGLSVQLGGGRTAGDEFQRALASIGVSVDETADAFERLPEISAALRELPDQERFERMFEIFGRDMSFAAIEALDEDLRSATAAMRGFSAEVDPDIQRMMNDWDRAGESVQGFFDSLEIGIRRSSSEFRKFIREAPFEAMAGAERTIQGISAVMEQSLPEGFGRTGAGPGGVPYDIPRRSTEEIQQEIAAAEVGYAAQYWKEVGAGALTGAALGLAAAGPVGAAVGAVALGPMAVEAGITDIEPHRRAEELRDMRARGVGTGHAARIRQQVTAATNATAALDQSLRDMAAGAQQELSVLGNRIQTIGSYLEPWIDNTGRLRDGATEAHGVMAEMLDQLILRYEQAQEKAQELNEANMLLATADVRRDQAELATLTGVDAINRSLALRAERLREIGVSEEQIARVMETERGIADITLDHIAKIEQIERRRAEVQQGAQLGLIGVTRGAEGQEQIARIVRDARVQQAEISRERLGTTEAAKQAEDEIASARRQYELDIANIRQQRIDAANAVIMQQLDVRQQHELRMMEISAQRGKEEETLRALFERQREQANERFQQSILTGLGKEEALRQRNLEMFVLERQETEALAEFRRQKQEEQEQARMSAIQSEVALQQRLIELRTRPGSELSAITESTELLRSAAKERHEIHRNDIQLMTELEDLTRQQILATAALQKRLDDEAFQRRQETLEQEIQIRQQITAALQGERALINENLRARIQFARNEYEQYGDIAELQQRIQSAYMSRQQEIIDMEARELGRVREAAGSIFDAMLMRGRRGIEDFFRGQLLVMVRQMFQNFTGEIFGSMRQTLRLDQLFGGQIGAGGRLNFIGRMLAGTPFQTRAQVPDFGELGLGASVQESLARLSQAGLGLGGTPEQLRRMSEMFSTQAEMIAEMMDATAKTSRELNRQPTSTLPPVAEHVQEIVVPEGRVTAEHRAAAVGVGPGDEALLTTLGSVRDTSTVLAQTNRGLQVAIEQLTAAVLSMANQQQVGVEAIRLADDIAGPKIPVLDGHVQEGTLPALAPIQIQAPGVQVIAPEHQPIQLEAASTIVEDTAHGFGGRLLSAASLARGVSSGAAGALGAVGRLGRYLMPSGPLLGSSMADLGRFLQHPVYAERLSAMSGIPPEMYLEAAGAMDYSITTGAGRATTAGAMALSQQQATARGRAIMRGAAIGYGAYNVIEGIRRGGTSGAVQGVTGGLTVASAIPGPHAPFTAAAAAILSVAGSFFGPDPEKRAEEIRKWMEGAKVDTDDYAPYNAVVTMGGAEVDYDFMGNMRAMSAEIGETLRQGDKAKGPIGVIASSQQAPVTVNVNAMDSKSFYDHRAVLADAVRTAVKQGHNLGEEIDYRASISRR